MKSTILSVAGAIAFVVAGSVSAQTCADPIILHSNETVSGNTCDASNVVPNMGPGFDNAQNDIVYAYVGDGANATIHINTPSNTDGVAYLLTGCNDFSNPIAFAYAGLDMEVNSSNSPDGATRYIVVTSDGTSAPTTCGAFDLEVTGTLPVELSSFSVD